MRMAKSLLRGRNVATAYRRMGRTCTVANPMDGSGKGAVRGGRRKSWRMYFKGRENVNRHSGWHECLPEARKKALRERKQAFVIAS